MLNIFLLLTFAFSLIPRFIFCNTFILHHVKDSTVNKVNLGSIQIWCWDFLPSPVIRQILTSHTYYPFEVIPKVVLCLNYFVGPLISWQHSGVLMQITQLKFDFVKEGKTKTKCNQCNGMCNNYGTKTLWDWKCWRVKVQAGKEFFLFFWHPRRTMRVNGLNFEDSITHKSFKRSTVQHLY